MKKQISRRDKVLQAALKMISDGGFHASPMSELAAQSGVAVGTIYHHFESKEALIHALYLECRERMTAEMMNQLDPKASVAKRFEMIWHNLHAYFMKNPLEFSLLRQYESSPFIQSGSEEDSALFGKSVLDFLRDGIKAGKLRKQKLSVLAALLFNFPAAVASVEMKEGKKQGKKELQELCEMSWASLKK